MTISIQTQFMHNALPAQVLDARQGRFFVVLDGNNLPVIFSISSDGKLNVVFKGPNGSNVCIILNDKLGLAAEQRVVALAVTQSSHTDRSLYICFAAHGPNDPNSSLYILKPVLPAQLLDWISTSSLVHLLCTGSQPNAIIKSLLMGSPRDGYPLLYVVYQASTKFTQDISVIQASPPAWTVLPSQTMPCNPEHIIDRVPGHVSGYPGFFVLYDEGGTESRCLDFVAYDPEIVEAGVLPYSLKPPPGACRLATFDDDEGDTSLLIAASDGLYYHPASTCCLGDMRSPLLASRDSITLGAAEQLFVAQSEASLMSVWVLNSSGDLCYQEFNLIRGELQARAPPVPLLPAAGGGGHFRAVQHPSAGQQLYVVQPSGSMHVLAQDPASRVWGSTDVCIPDAEGLHEFTSYTTLVKFAATLGGRELLLSASEPVEIIVNGRHMRGDKAGRRIQTDHSGSLTIIVETPDLGAPLLTLSDVKDTKCPLIGAQHVIIDPMSTVLRKIETLSSGNGMEDLKGDDGQPLSKEQSEKACAAFKQLSRAMGDVRGDNNSPAIADPAPVANGAAVGSTQALSAGSVLSWDFWHWVAGKISSAASWVVEKVQGAWNFIIDLGKGALHFVVDSVGAIARAACKVFQAIGVGIKSLVSKLGALFAWNDILDTKNILVNITTMGMISSIGALDSLYAGIGRFFDGLDAKVQALKDMEMPDHLAHSMDAGQKTLEGQTNADAQKKQEGALNSPDATFGSYHLQHGGESLSNKRDDGKSTAGRLLDHLTGLFDEVNALVGSLGDDVMALFKSDEPLGVLLKRLGLNLLQNSLHVLKKLALTLVGLIADLLVDLTAAINEPISIPVISKLYQGITHTPLTVLDATMLLVAIPVTVIYKLIRGEPPTKIPGLGAMKAPNIFLPELKLLSGKIPKPAPEQLDPTKHLAFDEFVNWVKPAVPFLREWVAPITTTIMLFVKIKGWFEKDVGILKKLGTLDYITITGTCGLWLWQIPLKEIHGLTGQLGDTVMLKWVTAGHGLVGNYFAKHARHSIMVFCTVLDVIWLAEIQMQTPIHERRIGAAALTEDEARLRTWIAIEDWVKLCNRFASSFAAFMNGVEPAGSIFAVSAIVTDGLILGSSMTRAAEANMALHSRIQSNQVHAI